MGEKTSRKARAGDPCLRECYRERFRKFVRVARSNRTSRFAQNWRATLRIAGISSHHVNQRLIEQFERTGSEVESSARVILCEQFLNRKAGDVIRAYLCYSASRLTKS